MDPRLYDAAAIASGFVPGSGLMDFVGQAPAIGGGMGPSFMQNIQNRQYLDALLQTAGAAGDALMVIPPVGMTVKAATTAGKTARAGSKAADALAATKKANALPAQKLSAEDQALVDLFGSKAAREAKLKQKVKKAEKSEPKAKVKTAKNQRVDPDVYRQMAATSGDAAVVRQAQQGMHLKPDGYGGYIGAPRTVSSPQALGAMRQGLDQQFASGVDALKSADPNRTGTWYDRAKAAQAQTNEPFQLPQSLNQHAVYSAGVSPESELGFALKHQVSRQLGLPDMAYRGAPMNNLDNAIAQDRMPRLGFKIGEYRAKNDPNVPNTGLFGVNDFRAAQGFGYTNPDGSIWTGGVSNTMHPFMDAETALLVNRANTSNVGGRADWSGPHLQEVPWVLGKAQDLYSRGTGPSGRYNAAKHFGGNEAEAIKQSIVDANNTFEDYLYKHAASATHESIPGASTGHVSQMLNASPEAKAAYTQAGSWNAPLAVDGSDKDVIYSALGMRQLPPVDATGAYMNSQGIMESNPMVIARPLLDFPTGGGGGRIAETRSNAMDAAERLRAVVDAQEAGAWNLPNTMGSVSGKNSAVIDSRALNNSATTGAMPSAKALAESNRMLDPYGYGLTPTSRGALLFPFNPKATPMQLDKALKNTQASLLDLIPGDLSKGVTSSGYFPGIGKFDETGRVIPTAPFSGEATGGLLEALAKAPPEVAANLSESEGIRSTIGKITARDVAAGGAREDIQNLRKFLSEADWNKAVKMIRTGATPAAALAAMGYSITSMAGQDE
jgi:hypothetical protein